MNDTHPVYQGRNSVGTHANHGDLKPYRWIALFHCLNRCDRHFNFGRELKTFSVLQDRERKTLASRQPPVPHTCSLVRLRDLKVEMGIIESNLATLIGNIGLGRDGEHAFRPSSTVVVK